MFKYQIFSDGGSRGNPGLAACAFIVFDSDGAEVYKQSKFLGIRTNNYAEYQGVVLALSWLKESKLEINNFEILFNMDSELVVKQLNGLYKVKDSNLFQLYQQVKSLLEELPVKVFFKSVLREKNKLADALVNRELDSHK